VQVQVLAHDPKPKPNQTLASLVGAELESTMKRKSENDNFCKIKGKVRFFKNSHFSVRF
jgi:hypothetical protein